MIRKKEKTMIVDVLILGKGPAGIQAALYTKRANLKTLIIGKDNGALAKAEKISNYYGIKAMSGLDLVEQGISQALALEIPILSEEVTGLSKEENFKVLTNYGEYEAKTVIMATGSPRTSIKIPGLKGLEGRGVSYCAVCDGFFYRRKVVGVVGNSAYAAQEAQELIALASSVIVFTNGKEPDSVFPDGTIIETGKINRLLGTDAIEAVEMEDGRKIELAGLFIALGSASSTDLALKIGALTEGNKIVTDEKKRTNVPGLFAAGDCTEGIMQISKAVADGCIAAIEAIAYVRAK